jgi:hypothetical protein
MKFVPRSIIGWFFIIFLTSGLIINSSSTGIIDYILMFLFSYTVVIIFSNIFSSDNSKIRNNTPIKNATSSEEDKLSKHLAQLEEVERIKNLKDDIKSKRESLGLISLEHYEALLKNI